MWGHIQHQPHPAVPHTRGTNHLQSFLQTLPWLTYRISRKTYLIKTYWKHMLHIASSHPSLAVVTVSSSVASSWNSLWDEALDYRIRGTRLMQSLFSTLSRPLFGNRLCPHCDGEIGNDLSFHQPLISQPLLPRTSHTGWKKRTSQNCSN